ncbi:hypothetical protein [Tistrella mobilis]|uniref:hypothetical protein n=1 Tax=Tistrella mobilis TaxID=171437 RepID=UPI0035581AEF
MTLIVMIPLLKLAPALPAPEWPDPALRPAILKAGRAPPASPVMDIPRRLGVSWSLLQSLCSFIAI